MHHVGSCDVTKCCFNENKQCHAVAIQVGDSTPLCDTFTTGNGHCGIKDATAEVGACKVSNCRFNKDLICSADKIKVGWVQSHAECVSFSPKS